MKKHFAKFKKWLSYDCPAFADSDGWQDYENSFKKNASVRYFFYKQIPAAYGLVTNPVVFRFTRMKDWVRFRIVRYHVIDTGLEPGYYDKSELMLHVNFNMLVNFVEVEKASRYVWSNEDKIKLSWWQKRFLRSREFGEKYLAWEISLSDPDNGSGMNISQARAASEILYLYTWWKDVRPARDDLVTFDSRYAEFVEEYGFLYHFSDRWKDKYPDIYDEWSESCKISHKRDEFESDQDQEMLVRLIKLRLNLWT